MACSVLTVKGVRKYNDIEAMEFARIAGMTFIRLQHIKGASAAEYGVRGFQSAEVGIKTDREGGKHYEYELSKDRHSGEDCMGQRQLLFQPEKNTGILTADAPDTPFNRDLMVKCYFNNAQWRIVDPILDSEIRKQAEEFQKSIPDKPTEKEVISDQLNEIERLKAEKRALEQKLRINAAAEEAIKDRVTESKDDTTGTLKLTIAEEKKLKDEARKEIYEEMSGELKKIQDGKGKAWFASKEYKETFLPVIEQRYQKKLEGLYAKHSGAGGDN